MRHALARGCFPRVVFARVPSGLFLLVLRHALAVQGSGTRAALPSPLLCCHRPKVTLEVAPAAPSCQGDSCGLQAVCCQP